MSPRTTSIRMKLVGINMLTTLAVLLLACGGFLFVEVQGFRSALTREAIAIAQIIAEGSQAALAFGDAKAARDTLAALKAESRISVACIYNADGALLASHAAAVSPRCPGSVRGPTSTSFGASHLEIVDEVAFDNTRIGWVYLAWSLTELNTRIYRYAVIVAAMTLACLVFALIISSILQKVISSPLVDLAATASRIAEEENYELRATKAADDEIGQLVDQFNGMLEQVHLRDLALQRAQDELEVRVADRTRELEAEVIQRKRTEFDLVQARDVAEDANRAKSAFLANMSHELRTPLTAIIGYSELLEEDAGDAGHQQYLPDLARIRTAGKHLLALINDVLDLSKIEAGRTDIRSEALGVGPLVDYAVSTVGPLIRQNGNQLVVDCPDHGLEVQADQTKFHQCLLNLLSNASKFTENGTITLRVIRESTQGGNWILWSVADTGIGIAPESLSKLFKSFSQVDSSATRRFGGTGLGLAISQRLCRMMGGDITVESVPSQGSTFTVRLPEAARSDASDTPGTVLLAGEDSPVRRSIHSALVEQGCKVFTVDDPAEALPRVLDLRPAGIILEMQRNAKQGHVLLQALRHDAALARIPVFAYPVTTSGDSVPTMRSSRSPGVHASSPLTRLLLGRFDSLVPVNAGRTALARVTEGGSGQVNLQLRIPEMSGWEFSSALLVSESWQTLSVVDLAASEPGMDLARLGASLAAEAKS